MSPERLQFLNKLKARNYSPQTISNHEQALLRPARYYNKSPPALTAAEIEQYLLHALEKDIPAPATVNMRIGAFKKFFALMLLHATVMESIGKVYDLPEHTGARSIVYRPIPAAWCAILPENESEINKGYTNYRRRFLFFLFPSAFKECIFLKRAPTTNTQRMKNPL